MNTQCIVLNINIIVYLNITMNKINREIMVSMLKPVETWKTTDFTGI